MEAISIAGNFRENCREMLYCYWNNNVLGNVLGKTPIFNSGEMRNLWENVLWILYLFCKTIHWGNIEQSPITNLCWNVEDRGGSIKYLFLGNLNRNSNSKFTSYFLILVNNIKRVVEVLLEICFFRGRLSFYFWMRLNKTGLVNHSRFLEHQRQNEH